ncbi:E3 ubiquitin-protein ligase RNF123 [Eumeta japonica]|uniref:RING-type E3 ubiquitin transferase n=1 Tax=Eumeta variegata TaxID=151549 RepID=A0A4C1VEQ6_EUMVA|nr:E3 ubiquitin-protein ligase RNF123 [Eumeta japonica]
MQQKACASAEEKLKSSAIQMAWVSGAMWTKKRQSELSKQFAGILHSLRLASDADYAAQEQINIAVGSKEILPGKSLLFGGISSYGSLELEYTSSSDQSARNPSSGLPTPQTESPFDINSPNLTSTLGNYVPMGNSKYAHRSQQVSCMNIVVIANSESAGLPRLPLRLRSRVPRGRDAGAVQHAAAVHAPHTTFSSDIRLGRHRLLTIGHAVRIARCSELDTSAFQSPIREAAEAHSSVYRRIDEALSCVVAKPPPSAARQNWDELMVSCATFLCAEFADQRIVLASTRESLVQTLASFATQPSTMRAIERVPLKQQMRMVVELLKPYQNRAWAQSNWVLVRFWHGSGFAFRYRQWPHLAEKYGDREPTVNNLGAKLDAGLMSQCFRLVDADLEKSGCTETAGKPLEMTLRLAPGLLMNTAGESYQSDLLLGRICQILMAVVSRVCGAGGGFSRLVARGLPDTDRVHHCVALAPVAGCLLAMLDPNYPTEHVSRVKKAVVSEPLFQVEGLDFMLGRCPNSSFSFYNYPDAVSTEELTALETAFEGLREAALARSGGSSSTQSDLLCTICYARAADTKFLPCGHYSCRACIMQHLLNSKQCFFCKAEVDTIADLEPCST